MILVMIVRKETAKFRHVMNICTSYHWVIIYATYFDSPPLHYKKRETKTFQDTILNPWESFPSECDLEKSHARSRASRERGADPSEYIYLSPKTFTNCVIDWEQDTLSASWWHITRPIPKPYPRHYPIPWCTGDYERLLRYFPIYTDIFSSPADSYSSIHHSHTYAMSSIHAYHSSIRLFWFLAIYAHFISTWLIPPLVTL